MTILLGSVFSQNCPQIPLSISVYYDSDGLATTLQLPILTRDVEIVTLKNGCPKDLIKFDSSVLNDPTKTTFYRTDYQHYSVNMRDFQINDTDYLVICIFFHVVQNGKTSPCRVCQLASKSCFACSFVLDDYMSDVKTFDDGTGQIQSGFTDLPILMTLEYEIIGQKNNSTTLN